ncbi:hypothetical protein, partial [Roseovarius albus]|uniref:hypothetical protein n=1 Tax=Roseovarius albus TaxID=1247867 RepID=UPI001F41B44D
HHTRYSSIVGSGALQLAAMADVRYCIIRFGQSNSSSAGAHIMAADGDFQTSIYLTFFEDQHRRIR